MPDVQIFNFSSFITALTLLVIVYTIADVRYRFRIEIAPLPLFIITYSFTILIGIGTLITDVLFSCHLWPFHSLNDQRFWQGLFAAMFLIVVLIWIHYAFIKPPIFNKMNYKKYFNSLYRIIVKGSDSELPIIADELGISASMLIKYSRKRLGHYHYNAKKLSTTKPGIEDYAYEILRLMGNRKLCRYIISSAPGTAIRFFTAMTKYKKYEIPIGCFIRNISAEAFINKDSNLYHEDDGYSSGLIGSLKPFSYALYGDYELIEKSAKFYGSPFDLPYDLIFSLDATQLNAYCKSLLIVVEDFSKNQNKLHDISPMFRAFDNLKKCCADIYKINEIPSNYFESDIFSRFNVVVECIKKMIRILNKNKYLFNSSKKISNKIKENNIYTAISELMFDIIFLASGINSTPDKSWSVQHNTVWGEFFCLSDKGISWKIIHFKLRRLLYDEVCQLEKFPNYKSARILGFCLNVMGLKLRNKHEYGNTYYALHRVILSWTRKYYLNLQYEFPDIAPTCIMGNISFDKENSRLIKTYFKGIKKELEKVYMDLLK